MSTSNSNLKKDFSVENTEILYKKQLADSLKNTKGFDSYNDIYPQFVTKMVDQVIYNPSKEWSPHVNGWYYCNMVPGTWVNEVLKINNNAKTQDTYNEFSPDVKAIINNAHYHMGHLLKDITPPQLNIDYDTISGRVRNINVATRVLPTSEFSIQWKDNRDLDIFRYHDTWIKYIDASKKGFMNPTSENDEDSMFIDIPYFNAMWIVIFKPFSFELQGLIKLMGVAPVGMNYKDILGTRHTPQMTTYTINYKVVDTIAVFYGNSAPSGDFYEEFLNDQLRFFSSSVG